MYQKIALAQGVVILLLLFGYVPSLMRLATSGDPRTIEMPWSLALIYDVLRLVQNPFAWLLFATLAAGVFLAMKARGFLSNKIAR